MIVCPNTSPLIVLARLERLDLLGDPANIRVTRAVQDEIRDKQDEVADRVAKLTAAMPPIVDLVPSSAIDPAHSLGPGERSVLSYALAPGADVLCVLDDAAARAEARRLGLSFTGTLGLVLKAKTTGGVRHAAPLLRRAVDAGLYPQLTARGRLSAASISSRREAGSPSSQVRPARSGVSVGRDDTAPGVLGAVSRGAAGDARPT